MFFSAINYPQAAETSCALL